jgi:hypothetical protein
MDRRVLLSLSSEHTEEEKILLSNNNAKPKWVQGTNLEGAKEDPRTLPKRHQNYETIKTNTSDMKRQYKISKQEHTQVRQVR